MGFPLALVGHRDYLDDERNARGWVETENVKCREVSSNSGNTSIERQGAYRHSDRRSACMTGQGHSSTQHEER